MSVKIELLISGANNNSGEILNVYSPYTNNLISEIIKPTADEIELAFENASKSFRKIVKKMPAYQRAEILYKTADKIRANIEPLARLIALEGGKPLKDARVEVRRAVNTVKFSADEALRLNGEQLTMDRAAGSENHLAFTIKEPVGPVLAISAFNHPVNLICHQVATAIAAGNSVIIKPSEKTPLSAYTIVEFIIESGFPAEAISLLPLTGAETEKIIGDHRISFVSFIGNAAVGWKIPKLIAPGVAYALEHGGTAAAVVTQNTDIEMAAKSITKGGYYHAGQVCVSTQNVFVHRSVYDEFKEKFTENVKNLVTGDPSDEKTDVGPIITGFKADEIISQINEAVEMGANLILGGKLMNNNCIEPTILENTDYQMKVMNSEIFGPVVNINVYDDINEVIEKCNNTPFSFQNAIYTKDIDTALKFSKEINSKAVIINDSTAFRVDWMPFGGDMESGFSTGGVLYSINDLVKEKLIVIKQQL